jgi:uncharacterized membrane protein YoaK (UPF0700 family)
MTTVADSPEERALPALLLLLTVVTGLVDAVSYLGFGHVFVANMTGNIVFLGFSAAGIPGFSVLGSLVAIAAFLAGAVAGGRASRRAGKVRALRDVAIIKAALLIAATLLVILPPLGMTTYLLLALLGLTMGLQNALARSFSVPDLTTTVLTMTLTGLAADSRWGGGTQPRTWRRIASVLAMFVGAAAGASLLRLSPALALGAAAACMLATLAAAHQVTRSNAIAPA